jgi:hypothetical protein
MVKRLTENSKALRDEAKTVRRGMRANFFANLPTFEALKGRNLKHSGLHLCLLSIPVAAQC